MIRYIVYSKSLNKFYIGESENLNQRLELHNSGFFKGSYTSKVSDWELFYYIKCSSRKQARAIENHVKKMKSKKYIRDLSKYPEIKEKLLKKYV